MNLIKMGCLSMVLAAAETAFAGGLLENTNQNIAFLRNPARDAAIGIDGVYSNPAGVVFLGEGFHLSLNMQNAHQTRTVRSTYGLYPMGLGNGGSEYKKFKGEADAPIIPSVQAAYNRGRWSFQFNFAVAGGGGKCEFDNGIPTFETSIAQIATMLSAKGYDMGAYMQGRQYYYGFTAGAAYKLTDRLSVYGGARLLYGSASYKATVSNIMVKMDDSQPAIPFSTYLDAANEQLGQGMATVENQLAGVQAQIDQLQAAGQPVPDALTQAQAQLQGAYAGLKQKEAQLDMLEPYRDGVNLMCDQTAWGIAPVIGIDYNAGKLNLAAKYQFKTRMRMKNKSTVKETSLISAINKFKDGETEADDAPALLTVGAQYEIVPSLRVMAGWHHYFDVDTKQYTKAMLGDSNEYLAGAELDVCKRLQVSAGMQRTVYDFNDEGMNDISFNVSSYSVGFGVGYNVTDNIKVNAAYFHTFYDDYDKRADAIGATNSFTRTNRVFGLGVDMKF